MLDQQPTHGVKLLPAAAAAAAVGAGAGSRASRFALVWESACLKELGGALTSFLAQQALTQVAQKSIQTFLYTGVR
jgi:hypothetical protein